MSNQCNLIKDILPLYVEDMVSTDTQEFVNAHLEHCAECRAELERMRSSKKFVPDIDTVKKDQEGLVYQTSANHLFHRNCSMCSGDDCLWGFDIT